MDDRLENVVAEDTFDVAENDVDLDATELQDVLADAPRAVKGKGKSVAVVDDVDEDFDNEEAWDWGL